MKIVLNTSPVIFLAKIDCLTLLKNCVEELYIPEAVFHELNNYLPPEFIKVHQVSEIGKAYVQGALGRLHQGELEAMILAKEITADYIVLDDLLARNKAQRLGIHVIGTIGLLLWLEKRGLLSKEQTWQKITQLTEQHGMYLSTPLLQQLKNKLFGIH